MRAILILSILACSSLLSIANAALESEQRVHRAKTHEKTGDSHFRLLERVQKQRNKEKNKSKLDKIMILKHAADREAKKTHKKHEENTKHSLATLSHGAAYASSKATRSAQLSTAESLSSLLDKHHFQQRESDAEELSKIHHILAKLDKTGAKKTFSSIYIPQSLEKQRQLEEKRMEHRARVAERRLKRMKEQEQSRKEELLDSYNLGGTETVEMQSALLETKHSIGHKAAPTWAMKPIWWKVPPEEVGDAGKAPWPNDPLYQNGYPATIIDPNNYPLSNVDDPNNYPALDDPNGAFAPIQKPH